MVLKFTFMTLLESLLLPMGEKAKDFSLSDFDGKTYSLENFSGAKVLVIVFMCNHCPYVQAVWGRLIDLQERFRDNSVQFVGINPNIGSPGYEDEETLEKMAQYSKKFGMNFPYLADENQEVAKIYQAQCTPDIYVFDDERKLVYHGRIDDNWKEVEKVKNRELEGVLNLLLKGEKITQDQKSSMGCSIKWK